MVLIWGEGQKGGIAQGDIQARTATDCKLHHRGQAMTNVI